VSAGERLVNRQLQTKGMDRVSTSNLRLLVALYVTLVGSALATGEGRRTRVRVTAWLYRIEPGPAHRPSLAPVLDPATASIDATRLDDQEVLARVTWFLV